MNYPQAQIGQLCLPTEQRDPRDTPDRPFKYVDISSVDKDLKAIVQTQEVIGKDAPSRARKVISADDVLVSTVRPNLNAVAIVPSELDGQIASTGFCVLRSNPSVVNARYLFYRALTRKFVCYLIARMRGANYPAVTDEVVRKATIPLPPLSEQRRIVEILDQADALRRKRTEADAKAERILHALFTKMFGDPTTNPMGWSKVALSDFTVELRYGTSTRCTSEPNGLPVLRIPNILHGEVDLSDLKYAELPAQEIERLLLEHGDLLFVRTNGNRDYVGRCAVFDIEALYLFASYLIRARFQQDKVDPWYVVAYLHTPAGRQAMSSFIRTTAGQSNISLEGLRQIPIPLHPLPMQRQFREHVEHLYLLRQDREKSGNSLNTTFSCLLHRAFSGDLTATWRESHMKEFLAEMEEQAKYLPGLGPHDQREKTALQESLF
jgi:type I restriction enzyme S subunit